MLYFSFSPIILCRFDYSRDFLIWALTPPGFIQDWHVGVRNSKTGKLMGFITGVPADISVNSAHIRTAEINFLCVHKSLRSKRLAPVLIKEITRRVNLTDRWQAVYTAGVVLPRPVAKGRYWHRSLNPKKLIEVCRNKLIACTIPLLHGYNIHILFPIGEVQPPPTAHDDVNDNQDVQAGRPPHGPT